MVPLKKLSVFRFMVTAASCKSDKILFHVINVVAR